MQCHQPFCPVTELGQRCGQYRYDANGEWSRCRTVHSCSHWCATLLRLPIPIADALASVESSDRRERGCEKARVSRGRLFCRSCVDNGHASHVPPAATTGAAAPPGAGFTAAPAALPCLANRAEPPPERGENCRSTRSILEPPSAPPPLRGVCATAGGAGDCDGFGLSRPARPSNSLAVAFLA